MGDVTTTHWLVLLAFFGLLAISYELHGINETLKGIRDAQETLAEGDSDV